MRHNRERIADLEKILDEIDLIQNDEWLKSLEERKLKELEFHDRDRDRAKIASLDKDTYEKFYGNKKYYSATRASKAYTQQWIDCQAKNNVFLDYACGNGFNAIRAAKAGATLSLGLDISLVSVQNARKDAQAEGVSNNCRFFQADAENTKLPDNSVDSIICSGMLHHLDLSCAFPELRRILVPGGRILCLEALDYNPAIKLYRMLTPDMRTEWEKAHILSMKDVNFASRFFSIGEIKYWHITGILAPHLRFIPLPVFETVDAVLTRLPFVKLLSWIFTFELIKPEVQRSEDSDLRAEE